MSHKQLSNEDVCKGKYVSLRIEIIAQSWQIIDNFMNKFVLLSVCYQ